MNFPELLDPVYHDCIVCRENREEDDMVETEWGYICKYTDCLDKWETEE